MNTLKKLAVMAMCCLCAVAIQAQTSGKAGDNITWEFNEATETLTLTGTGSTWDMIVVVCPWQSVLGLIKHAIVEYGITFLNHNTFCDLRAVKSISLPESLTGVGFGCFQGCMSLETITIPKSCTFFGGGFLYNCDRFKEIIFLNEEPPNVWDTHGEFLPFFSFHTERVTLYIPDGSVEKYRSAEGWKDFKTTLPLSKKIERVSIISQDRDYSRNEKAQVLYEVYPATAINREVTFASSDTNIVNVNPTSGQIECISPGTARITVATLWGLHTDYVNITVKKNNNSYLKSLTSNIEFKSPFNKDTLNYTLSEVPYTMKKIFTERCCILIRRYRNISLFIPLPENYCTGWKSRQAKHLLLRQEPEGY